MNTNLAIKPIILVLFLGSFTTCTVWKNKPSVTTKNKSTHCFDTTVDPCKFLYMIQDKSKWEMYGIDKYCFQDIVKTLSKPTGREPSWGIGDFIGYHYNSYSLGKSRYKDDLILWNKYYGCTCNLEAMPKDSGSYCSTDSIYFVVQRHAEILKPFEYYIGEETPKIKKCLIWCRLRFNKTACCESLDIEDQWVPEDKTTHKDCQMIQFGRDHAVLRESFEDSIGKFIEVGNYYIYNNQLIWSFFGETDTLLLHSCKTNKLIISGLKCTQDTIAYIRVPSYVK